MKSGSLKAADKVTDLSSVRREDTPRVTGTGGQDRLIDQAPRRRRGLVVAAGVVLGLVVLQEVADDGRCGGLTGVTPLTRYQAWIVEQAKRMGSPLAP